MSADIIYLVAGAAAGALLTWIFAQLRRRADRASSETLVSRMREEVETVRQQAGQKERELLDLTARVAEKDANLRNLAEKLENQKRELTEINDRVKSEFRVLAGEILSENSEKFTKENKERLDQLLKPFNENLKELRKKVEDTYMDESRERFSLKEEVKRLSEMNEKISEEANALTRALKGDSKTQGIWGEKVLERILENSGLEKGVDYIVQDSHTGPEGGRLIPDVIVRYPEKGDIIIDSKVSLVAYEQYINADDDETREIAMRAHVQSIRKHITSLASKNYQSLYRENSLDFVMMFLPNEPAYFAALERDRRLWSDAYEKGILLISPTNLIAALRMVENIWRQVKQERHVLEIATQGGALYDKFVLVMEELERLGLRLGEAQKAYDETVKRFTSGKGNLVSRAEKIKSLGAKTRKAMPDRFREDILGEESED